MKDKLSENQADSILKALDNAIAQGPWDESNFHRVIGKNLREIRDNFTNQANASTNEHVKMAETIANRLALRSGQQEIFIALYSSDGSNMLSWERILGNLPRQMISRPIYAQERDVKDIIKTKENKINEAYVSIFVGAEDLLQVDADKVPIDKLGKQLLSLKDKSLRLDNISRFVHHTGVYKFVNGRLVRTLTTDEG